MTHGISKLSEAKLWCVPQEPGERPTKNRSGGKQDDSPASVQFPIRSLSFIFRIPGHLDELLVQRQVMADRILKWAVSGRTMAARTTSGTYLPRSIAPSKIGEVVPDPRVDIGQQDFASAVRFHGHRYHLSVAIRWLYSLTTVIRPRNILAFGLANGRNAGRRRVRRVWKR